jgi:hypothetical protein
MEAMAGVLSAYSSVCFFRMTSQTIAMAASAMMTTPPTVPPAIAPTLLWDELLVAEGDGVVKLWERGKGEVVAVAVAVALKPAGVDSGASGYRVKGL